MAYVGRRPILTESDNFRQALADAHLDPAFGNYAVESRESFLELKQHRL